MNHEDPPLLSDLVAAETVDSSTWAQYSPTANIVIENGIDADALWKEYGGSFQELPGDLDLGDAIYSLAGQHLYARTDLASDTIVFHLVSVDAANTAIPTAIAVLWRATGKFGCDTKNDGCVRLITRVIGIHLAWMRGPLATIPLFKWETEQNATSGLMQFYMVKVGSDLDQRLRSNEEPASRAESARKQTIMQAATDGRAFSEQLVALHRRNAPEEEFLQAMLSEIQTNPAFALKDDLPADTTQLDVAKDMLPLLLEGCGIPYPKPAPKPRPKIERPKRQRTAPMNAEHRALLERVKLARAVAGNTRNKEPAPIVYILTHPKFPDHLKIGSCQNVDARLSKYQTCCPLRSYEMRHMEYCADGRVVEEYIKLQQAEAREGATEWYRLSVEQAWEIVKQAIIACAE